MRAAGRPTADSTTLNLYPRSSLKSVAGFLVLCFFLGGAMNDYLLSVVLGIIEGLTEFLPVSSTAHLRIAEALLNIDLRNGFWKMYTIVIQLGAIIALTVFFWRRILKLISTFPRGASGDRTILTHPLSLVLIAFIVTALPSFLLVKLIGKNLARLY